MSMYQCFDCQKWVTSGEKHECKEVKENENN